MVIVKATSKNDPKPWYVAEIIEVCNFGRAFIIQWYQSPNHNDPLEGKYYPCWEINSKELTGSIIDCPPDGEAVMWTIKPRRFISEPFELSRSRTIPPRIKVEIRAKFGIVASNNNLIEAQGSTFNPNHNFSFLTASTSQNTQLRTNVVLEINSNLAGDDVIDNSIQFAIIDSENELNQLLK